MSDTKAQADVGTPGDAAPPEGKGAGSRRLQLRSFELRPGRRDLWQIPVLLAAGAMLFLGLGLWVRSAAGPDFRGALDSVHALIERQDYDRAMAILNGPIRAHIADKSVTPDLLGSFYLLRADTLYLAQRQEGLNVASNNMRIVENYQAARRAAGATLASTQIGHLADTYVSLNRIDDALKELKSLGDAEPKLRHDLLKRIIERGLRAGATARQRSLATDLLAQLRNDPQISEDTRLWTVTRLARLSLDTGNPEDALRRVLPELERLDSRLDPKAAGLFLLLGRAYLDLGQRANARTQLTQAESIAQPGSGTKARCEVLLAQLDRQDQQLEQARDRLTLVTEQFPEAPVTCLAWLGLGEVDADLGDFGDSLEAYSRLVEAIASGRSVDVDAQQADDSMDQRFRDRFDRADYETALKYATLISNLYTSGDPPATSVLRLADAHRKLAEQLVKPLPHLPDGSLDVDHADPPTLEQARQHFAKAGALYKQHARLTLLGDPERSARSLWLAADSLDNAGDLDGAGELFAEYVDVRHDDPRQVEGKYRLARTFQARGDYATAAKHFEKLIADHPTSEEAYASYVPLAQCYLYNPTGENPGRAEQLLLQVISGDIFDPSAPEFRAGLIELGTMYSRLGRYPEAIRRLTEATERYPDLKDDPRFMFRLADTYRLSSTSIGDDLRKAMPQSERFKLRALRQKHLVAALDLYETVVQQFQQVDQAKLADLDRTLLRNALFYRGDCAFDLGETFASDPERAKSYYERAIRYYDTSAQRYADDPASLVAMIQIVNCYAALGKWREVQTAHERARARLSELPPEAWDTSGSPMDRRYWERWLQASVELDRLRRHDAAKAGASADAG